MEAAGEIVMAREGGAVTKATTKGKVVADSCTKIGCNAQQLTTSKSVAVVSRELEGNYRWKNNEDHRQRKSGSYY